MKYWLLMIAFIATLTGCATTKPDTITIIKNTYIEVPNELLERCSATIPPQVQAYSQSPQITKEYILTMYATNLLQDIALCDQQVQKIKQWNKQQANIFQSKSKEVKDEQDSGRATRDK